jgi:hypothetical protein
MLPGNFSFRKVVLPVFLGPHGKALCSGGNPFTCRERRELDGENPGHRRDGRRREAMLLAVHLDACGRLRMHDDFPRPLQADFPERRMSIHE